MKINKVIDTRQYEEGPNDKWYPIPGSGESNVCNRCGKIHEVHYYVEVNGKEEIVGGGCAKQSGMISEAQHKSLGSAAISLAKNRAQLEKLNKEKEIQENIISQVEKFPLPEVVKESNGNKREIWKMENEKVWVEDWMDTSERMNSLIRGWRNRQESKLYGKNFSIYNTRNDVQSVQGRIKKLEIKIKKLMEVA